jgi:Ca-activated chloride channel homolog
MWKNSVDSSNQPRLARVRRTWPSRALIVGLLVGALIGTGGAILALRTFTGTGGAHECSRDGNPLRVVVAPALTYVVTSAIQAAAADGAYCVEDARIVPTEPAVTAAAIEKGAAPPDVWIPDSTVWLNGVGSAVSGVAPRRLASSPLVFALPVAQGRHLVRDRPLDLGDLLPASGAERGPVQWVLPPPDRSAATVGAVLALRSAVGRRPDANTVVSTVLRGGIQDSTSVDESALPGRGLATPMSEQEVYAYNLDHPVSRLVAAYPAGDEFVFDYPYAVLTHDADRRVAADGLFDVLHSEHAQALFGDAGFRSADGRPASEQASPVRRVFDQVPNLRQAEGAELAYQNVLRPSRLLTLIDISGSMATRVPGAGSLTRLDLATQAAVDGLAVYTDDNAVGLWVFSTNLTPTTDYREVAPLAPLGRGADGVSGRERVAVALGKIKVSKGGTGLYDSLLAAVRQVRRTWDPERVNSVAVITDGGNWDPEGLTLDQLLRTLKQENDPRKPVAVFAIAYGPRADFASLQKISAAVGGKAYAAPDPRMINAVLRDAIGRRACGRGC